MAQVATGGKRGESRLQYWMLGSFVAGLVLGLVAYSLSAGAPWIDFVSSYVTVPIGQIFLRLLFMLVIPLLVSALVVGVAEMGEARQLRAVGFRTLGYTVIVSTIAVVIALLLVNLFEPGGGVDQEAARGLLATSAKGVGTIVETAGTAKTGVEAVLAIVPTNFVAAMSSNDIIAVMFFALFFGVGFLLVDPEKTSTLRRGFEGVFEISMRLIGFVIKLAPLAIFCFMFNLAAQFGWDLIWRLSAFVGVVLLALGLQMFGVFPVILATLGRKRPTVFFREIQEAMVMAFATASSNATLPTSLRVAEEQLRLPRPIARFVLTIGATANQNGSAMFEGVTVIFLAQFFGIELGLQQQFAVMMVAILGGIGTAGVPAGTLPVIVLILGMVGVPPEGIGLVLGVDRFLDMCRTTLNVVGDLVCAQVISRMSAGDAPAQAGG